MQDTRFGFADCGGRHAQVSADVRGRLTFDGTAPERLPRPLLKLALDQLQSAVMQLPRVFTDEGKQDELRAFLERGIRDHSVTSEILTWLCKERDGEWRPLIMPEKGEKLQIGDISQMTGDARVQKALKRLAADKAPWSVSQLVMWHVSSKLEWDTIARLSSKWANAHERSLAQDFAEKLDALQEGAVEAESNIGHRTGTASSTRSMIASDLSPSACPSKLRRTRWRRAGRASAWMSATATL